MSGDLILETPPAASPVLLAEVQAYLRLEEEAEIPVLERLVQAAATAVERHCRRALMRQGFVYRLPRWPVSAVRLPRPPLVSVDDVSVQQADGVWQSVAPTDYLADPLAEPGLLIPTAGVAVQRHRGVRVRYTAGYGEDWNKVPQPLRQAVIMAASHWFDHRDQADALPPGVLRLIAGYRIVGL